MFVIPELRLNDFRDVVIPKRRDLYERFGASISQYQASTNDPKKFSFPVNAQDSMDKPEQLQTGYDVQLALNRIQSAKTDDNQVVTLPVKEVTDTHSVEKPQNPADL